MNARRTHNIMTKPGAMLLEVVLAMGILVMAMGYLGVQFAESIRTGYQNERLTQAVMLAEAKLAQLDSGAIQIEREVDGDFGRSFPGYFWRFEFEEHDDILDMYRVTVEILYGQPEDDLEPGDIEDADVVTRFHAWRPVPATLNLTRDFGLSEEQLDEIAAVLPIDVVDPNEISPLIFANMELEELMDLLPLLIEQLGAGFGASSQQLQQAIDAGILDAGILDSGMMPPNGAEALFGEGQPLESLDSLGGDDQ